MKNNSIKMINQYRLQLSNVIKQLKLYSKQKIKILKSHK